MLSIIPKIPAKVTSYLNNHETLMNPSKLAKSVIEKNIQHRASITLIIL
jgi:hypothetical protein